MASVTYSELHSKWRKGTREKRYRDLITASMQRCLWWIFLQSQRLPLLLTRMSPEYEVHRKSSEWRKRMRAFKREMWDLLLEREKTDEKRLEGEEENNGYAYSVEVRLDLGKTDIKNVWKILESGVPRNILWSVHHLRHIQHLQSVSYCIIQNFCSNYQKGWNSSDVPFLQDCRPVSVGAHATLRKTCDSHTVIANKVYVSSFLFRQPLFPI